ncbi:hypothetical protein CEXT_276191 [Caerostris extrusa]|uniref:Uncharacterized protein n=1 Tax=Caerostris extrusa TaxID=172846 RepID=A0AAV4XZC2_CAEEX|nr:hypothetical protein CEXT_276191 [Caerostris extrusa]
MRSSNANLGTPSSNVHSMFSLRDADLTTVQVLESLLVVVEYLPLNVTTHEITMICVRRFHRFLRLDSGMLSGVICDNAEFLECIFYGSEGQEGKRRRTDIATLVRLQ